MKDGHVKPEHLSSTLMDKVEQAKGSLSANQTASVLKIVRECVASYKLSTDNAKILSGYMQLLNPSLKHQLPSVRQLAEELYLALHKLHGDSLNQ